MSNINDLVARIDGAITAVKDKARRQQQELLQDHLKRLERLKEYEKVQARIVEIAKPRLEALAKRAGDRVAITPTVSDNRRSVQFDFKSSVAAIALSVAAAPDMSVRSAVVDFDLRVVPVLWKFDSHSEFSSPIANFDADRFATWLDDRIVGFVELFVQIHEGEIYDRAEYVEDPVSGVKFPRFAAGATLEHGGRTHYFIDESTRAEFSRRHGLTTA